MPVSSILLPGPSYEPLFCPRRSNRLFQNPDSSINRYEFLGSSRLTKLSKGCATIRLITFAATRCATQMLYYHLFFPIACSFSSPKSTKLILLWKFHLTPYSLMSFTRLTPPQNRQIDNLVRNSKQQVDTFVGELNFQNKSMNTFCEIRLASCVGAQVPRSSPTKSSRKRVSI